MQIVPTTFIALAAIVVLAMAGPRRGLWVFLALTPLGAAAAFNLPAVGGASIGLVQLAVLVVFTMVFLTEDGPNRLAGTLRPGQPGFWIGLLWIYCVFSAMYAPAVFRGATDVFSISRSANAAGIVSTPLRPTTGNITQLFSMTLSVMAFFAFATLFRLRPDAASVIKAMAVATGVHFVLGWLDVASHAVGASALLEPIRTANYAILDDHRMIGIKRMVGGFAEASSFGSYSLGVFAFWLQFWLLKPQSRVARWMLVASLIVLLRSTSSGAYLAMVVYLMLFGGWMVLTRLRLAIPRQAVLIGLPVVMLGWLSVLALFAAYNLAEPVTAFLDRSIFNKLETSSGIERMSWNAQAFQNFVDTWGVGAGLGSVRASTWLMASLGSLGAIGTLIFVSALFTTFRARVTTTDDTLSATISALKAACFALLLSDLLTAATPNLGVFFFAMAGLITGMARATALERSPLARPALRVA